VTASAFSVAGALWEGRRRWATPGAMAQALDPGSTIQTPALDAIDAALVDVAEGRCERLIITMPPQEGKSQRISRRFPLWLLADVNPDLRLGIISFEHGMARRWGKAIRNDIKTHASLLKISLQGDSQAADEWIVAGHEGSMYCTGISGALTGRPLDGLIIDDPIKDAKQAASETYREDAWAWWDMVGQARLSPDGWCVLMQTRWHEDDIAGRLLAREPGDWRVLNIPALADHDPNAGQTDPLGREPGEWMRSVRRPQAKREAKWARLQGRSPRTFNAQYQGHPAPDDGDILQRGWWQFYDAAPWVRRDDGAHILLGHWDEVIQSWDMAFKDTDGSDYVVGQVWARRGVDVFLVDQVHDRLSFTETCRALRVLTAKWPQAVAKLVEDKANGTAVINALSKMVPALIPVEPDGGKEARARAVSPFVQGHNVFLPDPEIAPWVGEFIDEAAAFPNGTHDDQVDAFSQALNRLLLDPLLASDEIFGAEDFDEELADRYSSQY
jgi:predicted phage terminase large subunit-like protein